MPVLSDIKDYRNFNNMRLDNEVLKSIAELNNIDIGNNIDIENNMTNDTNIKIASKNTNTSTNANINNNNDNNDNDYDDDWDLGPDDDEEDDDDDSKNYSNLDLTRQVLRKVREYMKAEKMSMSEFARQTGVSKAWLSKLKHTDANLSLNTAQDLLHYMGYTLRLTREGSVSINKSRIKKYATKQHIAEGQQTKYVTAEGQQIQHITENQQTKYITAEGQQIAPTPSSVQQTQTSTLTQTQAPASTMSVSTPAAPVKLSPGQTITVSASTKASALTQTPTKSSIKDKNNLPGTGSLSSLMQAKKKIEANIKTTNNKALNKDEIDLLYAEDFFSTPMGQKK